MSIDKSLLTPGKIYDKHITKRHNKKIKIHQFDNVHPEKSDWIILKLKAPDKVIVLACQNESAGSIMSNICSMQYSKNSNCIFYEI